MEVLDRRSTAEQRGLAIERGTTERGYLFRDVLDGLEVALKLNGLVCEVTRTRSAMQERFALVAKSA